MVSKVMGMPDRAWSRKPSFTPMLAARSATMMLASEPTISRLPAKVESSASPYSASCEGLGQAVSSRITAGTLPMVLLAIKRQRRQDRQPLGQQAVGRQPGEGALGVAGGGEGRGDGEEAGEQQQQMPVHRADHGAAGQPAAQQQQARDHQRAGLARQVGGEQDHQHQHRQQALVGLVDVERRHLGLAGRGRGDAVPAATAGE